MSLSKSDDTLLALSGKLVAQGYHHVTPTPDTHRRVLARTPGRTARSLTDIFGWSLPFDDATISADIRDALRDAGMLDETDGTLRSALRLSTVRDVAFWHSAFPTAGTDAVFLGPDSYRFANLIADELAARPLSGAARIVDIGVGAGVGAVTAATLCPVATVMATDINAQALRLARVNAAAAGFRIDTVETSGLDDVAGPFDLVLLNPPYLMDDDSRAYRDGGGMHGAQLPFDLTVAALGKLAAQGRLILYTGSAILDGQDPLKVRLVQAAADHGCALRYREIDPDIFGEELDRPQYAAVERIALVSAIFTRD
ncbi:methyltransferase [Sphingomonas montana]|uniref:methyltransferase n=1 Tax=Sphingomonas montana TaxID=1843236 RepID=UPI00096FE774|nr:methyltransferase [Sphingomonas montana]